MNEDDRRRGEHESMGSPSLSERLRTMAGGQARSAANRELRNRTLRTIAALLVVIVALAVLFSLVAGGDDDDDDDDSMGRAPVPAVVALG